MLAHASMHLKADPHGAPATQLCGECLTSASLHNMVGGASTALFGIHITRGHTFEADAVDSTPSRAFTAFRSRAPPVLL